MRKLLDGLYAASAWLAGLCMIGVLAMVLLTIASRLLGFAAPGSDSYAGYAMAGAGFMALAGTLKKGEHIRVTLFIGMLRGRAAKVAEVLALAIATALSAFLAWYSAHLVWQSWEIGDVSMGIDATPLWIPQLTMAAGTFVFFIAFCDELVLELLGRRTPRSVEDAHHE
ncbi:TRAP transporter small permease subunit [Melaminivora sp.]|uniref:TRAP transporter small permease n=1 Tax=Melaminivora sp. TaxID=1933032 RepID=UPI0028A7192D|nr:TRAP transporter small permease subunit [Melaminivora sp.]